jgi:hypothetical protein
MTIISTDNYFSSTVDDTHLEEIKEDLHGDSPLIGYSHNDLEGTVTVIVDISEFGEDTDLRYYH